MLFAGNDFEVPPTFMLVPVSAMLAAAIPAASVLKTKSVGRIIV